MQPPRDPVSFTTPVLALGPFCRLGLQFVRQEPVSTAGGPARPAGVQDAVVGLGICNPA